MSQEIEIEFKNILTEDEFNQLKKELQIKDHSFITQHNDYFDTSDFSLKKQNIGLRIREKFDQFVITLKEPHEVGRLETHQILSSKEVDQFFNDRKLMVGDVSKRLNALHTNPKELNHLGRLTTHRAELKTKNGLLVLDHSHYFDKEDYEIEWEFSDYALGEREFNDLLNRYNIPKRPTQNKIVRFFLYKKLKESECDDELH